MPRTYSSFEKYMITITVMLTTVIEVLDSTIVNVSLPHMMGSFSASTDEITWVLTAYIVSAAICMPLTGLLIRLMGVRRLLLINIGGFLIASMLCGSALSLSEIVFFRILQGIFGASLVPLSQYILRSTFTREEQGKAMAIWGLGIMVGPILGPTLGGHITELFSWRWVFYVNLPFCVIGFLMTLRFITETAREKIKMDWLGLTLMVLCVGSFQIFLDRGTSANWFDSNFITLCLIVSCLTGIIFITRSFFVTNNIINLRIFKNRNFAISTLALMLFVLCVFGVTILQPLMLESLMGYTADLAGDALAPRGIASGISMMIVARLARRVDHRYLLTFGILLSTLGTYQMTQLNLSGAMLDYMLPTILQGFAIGFVFIPLSSHAFDNLKPDQIGEASGLYSFGRSMGFSIGISMLTTIMIRQSQVHWQELSSHIQLANPHYVQWAATQSAHPLNHPMTLKLAANLVQTQSQFLGFIDAFWIATGLTLSLLLLVPLLSKPQGKTSSVPTE